MKLGKPNAEALVNANVFLAWVRETGKLFSLYQEPAVQFLSTLDEMLLKQKGLERVAIEEKVQQRWETKQAKDFATSDRLRDELTGLGISISDTADGTRWEVTK